MMSKLFKHIIGLVLFSLFVLLAFYINVVFGLAVFLLFSLNIPYCLAEIIDSVIPYHEHEVKQSDMLKNKTYNDTATNNAKTVSDLRPFGTILYSGTRYPARSCNGNFIEHGKDVIITDSNDDVYFVDTV